jgi:hypothetical protein
MRLSQRKLALTSPKLSAWLHARASEAVDVQVVYTKMV